MATYSSAQKGRGPSHRRGESRRRGQWKLAYADFLTALMAFFLLLWLTAGSSAAERSAIAAYFTGNKTGSAVASTASVSPTHETVRDSTLSRLEKSLAELKTRHFAAEQVQTFSSDDALRIEVTDASALPLFDHSAPHLNQHGVETLGALGQTLAGQPVHLEVEGHTDAFPMPDNGNWTLSAARANSAWQVLLDSGVSAHRFQAISGRGASAPLLPGQPHAPANRRITIIVRTDPSNRLN